MSSAHRLPHGFYEIGIGGAKSRFRIIGADQVVEDLFPEPQTSAAYGPAIKKKNISDVPAVSKDIASTTDNPDRVKPFVDEMINAYGGLDTISRANNIRIVSTGRQNVPNLGWLKTAAVFYYKFPNKLRQEVSVK